MGETEKKSDDNMMAALAHGLGALFPVLPALVIWLTQKDKSEYVSNQALQAMVYQLVVWVVLIVLWIVSAVLTTVVIGFLCLPVVLLIWIATIIYSLFAAYKTYNGEQFKYVVIGDLIK